MIKRTILFFMFTTLSSFANAQSIASLNSILSATSTNPQSIQKAMPYVGKDMTVENVNHINIPTASKLIC
jgi:hypothetical protein